MRGLILFAVTLATTSVAYAQSGTIRKVKGKSAIIRFDEKPNFQKGDRINLGGSSSSRMGGGNASRNYSLSLEGGIETQTVDIAILGETETETMTINAIFMLNKEIFEFGGGLLYNSTTIGSADVTEYSFVGVGEYNIIRNTPGTVFVPALQALVGISNYEATGGTSGNGFRYGAGVRFKFFPWNDSFAIVAAIGLASSTIDVGGGAEIATDVTGLTYGIQGYF